MHLHIYMKWHELFLRERSFLNNYANTALAGVAQWIEWWPANQRVAYLIPSLGHMPGLQATSPVGGRQQETTH